MPFAGAVENTNFVNSEIEQTKGQNTISNSAVTTKILAGLNEEQITSLKNWLKEKNFNTSVNDINLTIGSSGEDVKSLQKWLKEHNFYAGEIDGQYGNDTQKAVYLFQKTTGIQEDGWVGVETLKTMQSFEKTFNQGNTETNTQKSSSIKTVTTNSSKTSSKANKSKNSRKYISTGSYSHGKGTGDCWVNSAYLYSQITGSGNKARIIQYKTSLSPRHRSVQVYQNGAWVDYNYKANGYAKRYYATKSKPGMTVLN